MAWRLRDRGLRLIRRGGFWLRVLVAHVDRALHIQRCIVRGEFRLLFGVAGLLVGAQDTFGRVSSFSVCLQLEMTGVAENLLCILLSRRVPTTCDLSPHTSGIALAAAF